MFVKKFFRTGYKAFHRRCYFVINLIPALRIHEPINHYIREACCFCVIINYGIFYKKVVAMAALIIIEL